MTNGPPDLYQVVTYWAPYVGEDPFRLEDFERPQHIRGHWKGGVCYTDRDVREGGYIMCGVSHASDPRIEDEAREIMEFARIPCLRSLDQQRVATLL